MTEDYKKLLFDYITGQVSNTPSSTDEVFMDQIVANTNLLSLLPVGTTTYYINGIVSNNDDTSEVYAMYGSYDNGGFIALLDNDFNVFEVITEFSSGTALRTIYALEVNTEDNTFYGVDYNGTTNRFIMLNNFTIPDANGDYKVKLRTSYNFSDNAFYPSFCRIFKNPTTAHYIIVGQLDDEDSSIKAIDLKVNVGQANEWNSYSSTYNYSNNAYVEFDSSDNVSIITVSTQQTDNTQYIMKLTKGYSATTFTRTNISSFSMTYAGSLAGFNSVAFISANDFYYSLLGGGNTTPRYRSLFHYNGSASLIHVDNNVGSFSAFQVKAYNGELYIYYNDPDGNSPSGRGYYFRYNGVWKPIRLEIAKMWGIQTDIFIGSKYNLTKIFLFGRMKGRPETCLLVEDYNTNNYNSYPYVDGTAIYPQKCRLYSSGDLVFARNDYNVSSLGNTYTTTVEVPNVYLNSGNVDKEQLISKTNQVIAEDILLIDKNIYEKVYINFVNSINAYDEDTGNNFDTTTLVKNISGLGDTYTNSYIGYWNTTLNGTVVDSGTIDNYTYLGRLTGQFDLSFTPSGVADRLNFLDNNGNIYAWIDISNCVVGTTYDISQKVRLADIPLGNQTIIWDDNNVQFNGKDVVYYTSV